MKFSNDSCKNKFVNCHMKRQRDRQTETARQRATVTEIKTETEKNRDIKIERRRFGVVHCIYSVMPGTVVDIIIIFILNCVEYKTVLRLSINRFSVRDL